MKIPNFSKFNSNGFRIAVLGDMMCEKNAVNSIVNSDPFKYIRNYLLQHDYVVGNLETTFSGFTSNFPKFSSGEYYAEYLAKDIDFLFTANNHSYDWDETGVQKTIKTLNNYNINHIGIHAPNAQPLYKNVIINNHNISFLNYTEFINGPEKDTKHKNHVFEKHASTADAKRTVAIYDETHLKKAINHATKTSDVLIGGFHLSNQRSNARELSRESTEKQRRKLEFFVDLGINIAIGGHPHYFQGGKIKNQRLMVWSLGNFFTLMDGDDYENNTGCVLSIQYDSFLNPIYKFLPVATVYNNKDGFFYVIPISPLTFGCYDFITPTKRKSLLKELFIIREILRECELTEDVLTFGI